MTEEQRKDAMMALGRIVLSIEGLKIDYKQDVQTIIYALQSPPVPVIEGLEEAIERGSNPQMTGNEALDLFECGDFAKIIKAAHAYAELQKGSR